jgi:hypothetical protein
MKIIIKNPLYQKLENQLIEKIFRNNSMKIDTKLQIIQKLLIIDALIIENTKKQENLHFAMLY